MTVRFRGVRGSLPAPAPETIRYGGNTSCVELRCGDQLLILDAGSGIRLLGEDLIRNANSNSIEAALLISHTHWDHIQGLPFFGPGYSVQNRVRVLGAYGSGPQLQRALSHQMSPLHFPVGLEQMLGLRPVEELDRQLTTIGNFVIQTAPLNHPGGCSGFRIEAAQASMAYLPDHEPYQIRESAAIASAHEALVKFIRDVDLLILDTQYTAEEYVHRSGWGHGCLTRSIELALDANARQLMLFHHDPTHDDRQIDQMVETGQALATGSNLRVAAASEHEAIRIEPDFGVRLTPNASEASPRTPPYAAASQPEPANSFGHPIFAAGTERKRHPACSSNGPDARISQP